MNYFNITKLFENISMCYKFIKNYIIFLINKYSHDEKFIIMFYNRYCILTTLHSLYNLTLSTIFYYLFCANIFIDCIKNISKSCEFNITDEEVNKLICKRLYIIRDVIVFGYICCVIYIFDIISSNVGFKIIFEILKCITFLSIYYQNDRNDIVDSCLIFYENNKDFFNFLQNNGIFVAEIYVGIFNEKSIEKNINNTIDTIKQKYDLFKLYFSKKIHDE